MRADSRESTEKTCRQRSGENAARGILAALGYFWALPHTAIGVILLLTAYFPRSISWSSGALEVVVRWSLIPKGMNNFVTGAQTHGWVIFYADEKNQRNPRLRLHERYHVAQCMILGGVLYPVAYGLSSLVMLLTPDKHFYRDNVFEIWARAGEERGLPWILR